MPFLMVILVFLLRIGRVAFTPGFAGADAMAVLRPARTHCRRKGSISGAKATPTRRFEAKTDVDSASTHPGSLPTIKRIQKKTNSQACREAGWRQSRMATKPDGDK